jgi:hypothetical protein
VELCCALGEQTLDAPELLAEVAEGVTYVNGVRVKPSEGPAQKKAAAWAHWQTDWRAVR